MLRRVTLVLLLSSLLASSSGCAHRSAKARAAMAIGGLALITGLLLAGGCDDDNQPNSGCGSSRGGHPKIGAPLAAAGLAAMAAGDVALRSEHGRGPRRRNRGLPPLPPPVLPDPFVPSLYEPVAGSPIITLVR
ncbi:MAG: hypothetical protein QM778_24675 [Myxococcales bacterium]